MYFSVFIHVKTKSVINNPSFIVVVSQYAKWISKTSASDLLNCAANIALRSFDQAVIVCTSNSDLLEEMSISPITDSASALRNLLSRSPDRFTSSEALLTLESKLSFNFSYYFYLKRTSIAVRNLFCFSPISVFFNFILY